MDIGEFIDTYSDDVLYLHEVRTALLTHPLIPALKDPTDASACRLLAVFMIGSIEVMLEAWRDRDHIGILSNYFSDKRPNGEKVSALHDAFHHAGIEVSRDVFDDYLAIKYLRNTIIHGRWKEREKEWVEGRGFPSDTRKLTDRHLNKIEDVNQNMMYYIFLTRQADHELAVPYRPNRLATQRADVTGKIRLQDINGIMWNNLERILSHLQQAISAAATCGRYDWTGGRSDTELDSLGAIGCKRLFYLAARRASEEGYPVLIQHRDLAREALEFWREYWQRAVAPHQTDWAL